MRSQRRVKLDDDGRANNRDVTTVTFTVMVPNSVPLGQAVNALGKLLEKDDRCLYWRSNVDRSVRYGVRA